MFTAIFYQPIFNLLVFLYNYLPGHDMGLVIIILTIIVKLILNPLSKSSIKNQKALQDLQPKIDELKIKYANDKQELSKQMMVLYKENKVNPFSSCLPLLIQLPFLLAVFQVFRSGLQSQSLDLVYSFISKPEMISPISLGLLDLSKPSYVLALSSGITQYWQAKMFSTKKSGIHTAETKDEDMTAIMNKQMMIMMPILTVVIGVSLPAGLSLYWFVSTLISGIQQIYVLKNK